MSNILTIMVTLMIYFLSHSLNIILDIANRTQNILIIYFTKWLKLLFPPYEALNIKDFIWSFKNYDYSYFFLNTLYSIIYLVIILYVSILIFDRKKFEN